MIELLGVQKSFGQNHVLRGVDLTIARGTSMVVIGGSGTGKSVLLKSSRSTAGTTTLVYAVLLIPSLSYARIV